MEALWLQLFYLGVLFIAVTQGAQFWGLSLLPSVAVSLLLSFSPIVVIFLGAKFLNESPTKNQIFGVSIYLIGTLIYFLPIQFSGEQFIGIMVVLVGVFSNAGSFRQSPGSGSLG